MLFAVTLCVTDVMAQPGGGRGGRQGGRQRGGPGGAGARIGGGPQFLLRRDDVQKDLELSEEQIELIEEMSGERGRGGGIDRDALRAELEGLSDEERSERLREMRDERTADAQKKIEEILLPHQVERLAQISAQFSAQGGSRSLTGGSLAEKLGITDEQKEKIREKSEELQKELNEKIAKLRQQMQEELLNELTPDQQAQYKEMMGEAFKFEQQQRGGFGGPGGGGIGGRRGGGGQRGRGAGGRGGDRGGEGGRRGGRGGERQDRDPGDDF